MLKVYTCLRLHVFCKALTLCLSLKTALHKSEGYLYRQLANGSLCGELFLESYVVIAIQGKSGTQVLGHPLWEESVSLSSVDAEAFQFSLVINKAQPVAIGEGRRPCHIEANASYLFHLPDILAHCLRRIEADDIGNPSVKEIVGKTAVECLLQVGLKTVVHHPVRSSAILLRTTSHYLVESATVSRDDILYIVHVLQSPFYLERTSTSISKVFKSVYLAQVLQRQQVALMLYLLSVGIDKVKLQSAELGALSSVG